MDGDHLLAAAEAGLSLGDVRAFVDTGLAQRLASDAVLARHLMAVTGRHLVVREEAASAFRQRLRKLGFGVSARTTAGRSAERPNAP